MSYKTWTSEDPVLAVFAHFLQVQSEATADSGVNGYPRWLGAYKVLSRQTSGLGQTTDWLYRQSYEPRPPVKSQPCRPEEFRVQETRARGLRGCLRVKVEASDSEGGNMGLFHTVVFNLGKQCYVICLYGRCPGCLWVTPLPFGCTHIGCNTKWHYVVLIYLR